MKTYVNFNVACRINSPYEHFSATLNICIFLQRHVAQQNTENTLNSYANASQVYFTCRLPLFSYSALPIYLILLSRHASAQGKRSLSY